MNNYVKYNPNDKKNRAGDCVIRALCKALDKSWLEVFDLLVEEARKQQDVPNSREVYEQVLLNHGFVYNKISNARGTRRPRVSEMAKQATSPIVMNVANHVVTACDGKYYDLWDSGNKCLYGYYTKGECHESHERVRFYL